MQNLTKQYGNFKAVDSINFEVNAGEIFGFLGANGAGKTTAMRVLCGLSYPTSGEAWVAGFNVYHQQEQIKKHIGYMSQKFSLYENLTVWENIQFYGGIYGVPHAEIRKRGRELIYEAAAGGITVFVTTHYMDEAEYCNRICVLVDGRVEALDTPSKLKSIFNASSMEEVFYQLARGAKRKSD